MRKGIITGVAVSAVLHAGFVFGSNLFPKEPPREIPKDAVVKVDPLILPPETPEPVDSEEKVKELEDRQSTPPVPDIPDEPKVRINNELTQVIEPPKPQGQDIDTTKIPVTMPSTRTASLSEIFTPDKLQKKPDTLSQGRPVYPYQAVQSGLEGTATVSFIVTSSGEVVGAQAVRSTDRVFEQPAVDAVTRWKFRAGMKDGRYVNTRMVVEINFTLDK